MDVTFLLTDIEQSTRLWEEFPAQMPAELRRHDDLVERLVTANAGRLIKTKGEGDSTFSVFSDASNALVAAVDIQRGMNRKSSQDVGFDLRVRIGIHGGAAEERAGDYYGPTVNRAARLRAVGHGGQILVSKATVDGAKLPGDASLKDLGTHRLKDLAIPEHVYQLCHPELDAEFPPLNSLDVRRNNLPVFLTPFIGRQSELERVIALAREARLVTITGTGGVGKTRLGLQAAAELAPEYPGGVWLAEFGDETDATRVLPTVMRALGIRDQPGRTNLDSLIHHLGQGPSLLVMDNCEHLIDACVSLIHQVLSRIPKAAVIATSREPLSIPGESVMTLQPFPLPAAGGVIRDSPGSEALDFFISRIRATDPEFNLSSSNVNEITEICRKLEGLPLALELIAPLTKSLPPGKVVELLSQSSVVLGTSRRMPQRRHQSLREALEWSYRLLPNVEQELFQLTAVFRGGFTLESISHVMSSGFDSMNPILGLVNRSLITFDPFASRYRMLETVRQFAEERLEASGRSEDIRDHHLNWCLHVANFSHQSTDIERFRFLELEDGNIVGALQWAVTSGKVDAALELCASLGDFWVMHGHWAEGLELITHAIEQGHGRTDLRYAVLLEAGRLAYYQMDHGKARAFYRDAMALCGPDDLDREAWCCLHIAAVDVADGQVSSAETSVDSLLAQPGITAQFRAQALNLLGEIACIKGDYAAAREMYQKSLILHREVGQPRYVAMLLSNIALTSTELGQTLESKRLHAESLRVASEIGDCNGMVGNAIGLALLAAVADDCITATRLLAAAANLAESWGIFREPAAQSVFGRVAALCRKRIGAQFDEWYSVTRELPVAQSTEIVHDFAGKD